MVVKYELLLDSEIIENYKKIKEKQREKNKIFYDKLKTNKVKYRKRLTEALEAQQEKIKLLKETPEIYEEFKKNKNIINLKSYYNKIIKNAEISINNLKIED